MIEQGSEEWFAQRLGKATASKIQDIISKGRGGAPSAGRRNYHAQLVLERLTGRREETYTSPEMQWGTDNEAGAASAYEFLEDVTAEMTGFVDHPTIPNAGASPDRLIGSVGLLEIKCPKSATHLEFLNGAPIPAKYITQMNWQLACMPEREWCDFVSFDPRMPQSMQLEIRRHVRNPVVISELEHEVQRFLMDVDDSVKMLRMKYETEAAAA